MSDSFFTWKGTKYVFNQSQTNEGMVYTTTFNPDGWVSCTCPGFFYRQKCRHVEVKG